MIEIPLKMNKKKLKRHEKLAKLVSNLKEETFDQIAFILNKIVILRHKLKLINFDIQLE